MTVIALPSGRFAAFGDKADLALARCEMSGYDLTSLH
jgi:hypothetical protein